MSTFTGGDTPQTSDVGQQLAPKEGQGPDFQLLKRAFEETVRNSQPFVDQCRLNYETRYAIWNGQSADGKKHAREGSKTDPTPWDGASDLRVYLVDDAINKKIAMLCMAFRKANVVAVPVEGNDIKRSKIVGNFIRWLIQTQIPEISREVELLANYLNENGVAATGQFWETTQEKTITTLSLEDFQKQFPTINIFEAIQNEIVADDIKAIFEEIYGCSRAKATKILKELRKTGKSEVYIVGREKSRPIVRAFNLNEDLFLPPYTTDIENAAGIYRIQYFTAEQLRQFANTEGWDKAWVEKAIDACKGKLLTATPSEYLQPLSRSFVYTQQRFSEMIGVVYAYQRLSDEDGVPGIYLTIFNPMLPGDAEQDGYAKYGLLGYAHGEYPFVLHRREFLSRKVHDSRGLAEPGKPWQDQIKAHKDSRIDAASLGVLPPFGYPSGRPPAKWGPGAQIPERRVGEYHFMDRPIPDLNTENSELQLREDFKAYVGFTSKESDPQFSALQNQHEVNKFMEGWSKAFRQIFKLYQQYGSDEVYFRVIGLQQSEAAVFTKGDPKEDFDFYLSWDVQSMDFEKQEKKFTMLAKVLNTFDKQGQADYSEILQIVIEAIDPNWAERIIQPANIGAQKVVTEMQDKLAKVFAGQDQDISIGTPPQIGLQVIQQYLQGDPMVQQRMQNKQDPFGQRIQKLAKQLQFQITQQNNARIGRLGA